MPFGACEAESWIRWQLVEVQSSQSSQKLFSRCLFCEYVYCQFWYGNIWKYKKTFLLSESESQKISSPGFALCASRKHLSTKIISFNCKVEDWEPCNLSANNLWINRTGFVYTMIHKQLRETLNRARTACLSLSRICFSGRAKISLYTVFGLCFYITCSVAFYICVHRCSQILHIAQSRYALIVWSTMPLKAD